MDSDGDWRALGREVQRARLAAGYSDTAAWAERVGRSDRMLLGLERGERVGPKTLALVAAALGKDISWVYDILHSTQAPAQPAMPAQEPAGRPLSVVREHLDDPNQNEVIAAILRDPYLLPEAKAHFLNQYELLLRIHRPDTERLPYVAHGQRTGPVDPEEETRIEQAAREAADRNPNSPQGKK